MRARSALRGTAGGLVRCLNIEPTGTSGYGPVETSERASSTGKGVTSRQDQGGQRSMVRGELVKIMLTEAK